MISPPPIIQMSLPFPGRYGAYQPDGRGQDKIAPTLIGAAFTLGSAEIPIRILLNGKEGAVDLMPPIGSKLTDEQIASVLTYVRREWRQTAMPVDADTVKGVYSGHMGNSSFRLRQDKLREGPLEGAEREFLLRRRQRVTLIAEIPAGESHVGRGTDRFRRMMNADSE